MQQDKWAVSVNILKKNIKFNLDTVAKSNKLTLESYQQLMHTGELKPSKGLLWPYSNHKIKPVAAVDLTIKYEDPHIQQSLKYWTFHKNVSSVETHLDLILYKTTENILKPATTLYYGHHRN